jgi:cytochrome c oxidase subunit 2
VRTLLLMLALVAFAIAVKPAKTVADDADIAITASDFSFSPNKITLHVGTPTTLRLESTDDVHGFASPELGIDTTLIRPGHPVTLTIVPKKAQAFIMHCANFCGLGHGLMQLAVEVVP